MKSKKVTMLVAALVVAVVAAAGIGFATAYSATTENNNNSLKSTYLTISQSGDGAYTDNFFTKVFYNTETDATKSGTSWDETVTYKPVLDYGADYTKTATTKTMALVSEVLTLAITPMNNDQTSATLVVTASNFTPDTALTYTMIVAQSYDESTGAFTGATAGSFDSTAKTWTFTVTISKTAVTNFSVALFISGNTTTPIENAAHTTCAGFAGSEATNKTGFEFVLTANEGA